MIQKILDKSDIKKIEKLLETCKKNADWLYQKGDFKNTEMAYKKLSKILSGIYEINDIILEGEYQ